MTADRPEFVGVFSIPSISLFVIRHVTWKLDRTFLLPLDCSLCPHLGQICLLPRVARQLDCGGIMRKSRRRYALVATFPPVLCQEFFSFGE